MLPARNTGDVDPALEAAKTVGLEADRKDGSQAEEALGRRFRAFGTALLGVAGPRLTGRGVAEQDDETADSFYELVKRGRREPGRRLAALEPDAELRESAAAGDLDCAVQALEAKANVEAASTRGVTPLMFACASASTNALLVIQELLDRSADANRSDHWGWSSLHYACRSARTEAMRCLMHRKADPEAVTTDEQTVLILAVIEGKLDIVREMLREQAVHGLISVSDQSGATPLHYSARLKSTKMMRLLMDYKAKVHARDAMGRTVMSWACDYGGMDFVKALFKKKADIKSADAEGRTALYYAIRRGDEPAALLLLNNGAQQDRKDMYGHTPYMLAKELGLAEVAHAMKVIEGSAI